MRNLLLYCFAENNLKQVASETSETTRTVRLGTSNKTGRD
jgi:hypothetical protein